MFWSILHRTILWELTKVFLLSLIALTGMVLLAGIVAEASQRGLGPGQVLAAIPLIVPSTLPYTIPATTLFATCLVYGRLAADNEILAIKAAGVSILRIVWPGALLGVLTSVATSSLYYHFIPYTQYALRAQFMNDVEEFMYGMLRQERCLNHPKLSYAIWVHQVQGRRLVEPTFKRRDLKGEYDLIVHAREAELRVDSHNRQVLVHMKHGEVFSPGSATHALFVDRVWEVPLPDAFLNSTELKKAREMTWPQLQQRRAEILADLADVAAKTAVATSQMLVAGAPADLPRHLDNLKQKRFYTNRELLSIEVEMQMRPSIAVGCLCFVLVGCPVGIWFSRSDHLSAFVTCFLPIVFIYYPLMLCGINIARNGRFNVAPCVWGSDCLMALASLFLIRRLMRN